MAEITQKIGWKGAGFIVVANMIGTGVFTSLGFQLLDVENTWSILLLWTLGGLMALFGALSYAELGTHLPKSGGEYHFLSRLFHPFIGYLSGWVSLSVGFAAPVALAAIALGAYSSEFTWLSGIGSTGIAITIILLVSVAHSYSVKRSNQFQTLTTSLKIGLLLLMVIVGLAWPAAEVSALDFGMDWKRELFVPGFAVALVFVSYSYSGWNAAAYIVEEIETPRKNLPLALVGGTVVVLVLYVLLQLTFLRHASVEALSGRIEIGQIVANLMFGSTGGHILSGMISLLLVSSISAMVWVGPRVTYAMSREHALWRFLAVYNANGVPVRAIWFQSLLSIFLILTGTFEQVLLYSGFVLQIFSALAVAGVFRLRARTRSSNAYRSPLFPVIQITYLLFSVWILVYLFIDKPRESLIGSAILLLGAFTYWISRRMEPGTDSTRTESSQN